MDGWGARAPPAISPTPPRAPLNLVPLVTGSLESAPDQNKPSPSHCSPFRRISLGRPSALSTAFLQALYSSLHRSTFLFCPERSSATGSPVSVASSVPSLRVCVLVPPENWCAKHQHQQQQPHHIYGHNRCILPLRPPNPDGDAFYTLDFQYFASFQHKQRLQRRLIPSQIHTPWRDPSEPPSRGNALSQERRPAPSTAPPPSPAWTRALPMRRQMFIPLNGSRTTGRGSASSHRPCTSR